MALLSLQQDMLGVSAGWFADGAIMLYGTAWQLVGNWIIRWFLFHLFSHLHKVNGGILRGVSFIYVTLMQFLCGYCLQRHVDGSFWKKVGILN